MEAFFPGECTISPEDRLTHIGATRDPGATGVVEGFYDVEAPPDEVDSADAPRSVATGSQWSGQTSVRSIRCWQ